MTDELAKSIGNPEQEERDGVMLDDVEFERIKTLYKNQVATPATPPKKRFFLCPVGLVGAGKTTVMKPLAERFHLVRISTDEIRRLLKDEGFNRIRAAELAFVVTKEFVREGHSIAIDGDCAGKNVADAIVKTAKELNMKVLWFHINPPEEFIIGKLKKYEHTWLFADAADAITNYHRRKPLHENLDFPFLYTFDTSRSDLPKQLDEAAALIEESLQKD